MEYMRINAERERIKKYQQIINQSAILYYRILKRIHVEMNQQSKDDKEQLLKEDKKDPQVMIQNSLKETKIKNLMTYITDFLKQIVENGCKLSKSHFFMLLMNLDSDDLAELIIVKTVRIMIEEMEVTKPEFNKFTLGIKDAALQKTYFELANEIFG